MLPPSRFRRTLRKLSVNHHQVVRIPYTDCAAAPERPITRSRNRHRCGAGALLCSMHACLQSVRCLSRSQTLDVISLLERQPSLEPGSRSRKTCISTICKPAASLDACASLGPAYSQTCSPGEGLRSTFLALPRHGHVCALPSYVRGAETGREHEGKRQAMLLSPRLSRRFGGRRESPDRVLGSLTLGRPPSSCDPPMRLTFAGRHAVTNH